MKNLIKLALLISFLVLGNSTTVSAGHNLDEIEDRCEVIWYGDLGKLECLSSVSNRTDLERMCIVLWYGDEGKFHCKGGHFAEVERECEVEDDGEIDC